MRRFGRGWGDFVRDDVPLVIAEVSLMLRLRNTASRHGNFRRRSISFFVSTSLVSLSSMAAIAQDASTTSPAVKLPPVVVQVPANASKSQKKAAPRVQSGPQGAPSLRTNAGDQRDNSFNVCERGAKLDYGRYFG